jgi:hypothetical protein
VTGCRLFGIIKEDVTFCRWTQVSGGGRLMAEIDGHNIFFVTKVDHSSLFIV